MVTDKGPITLDLKTFSAFSGSLMNGQKCKFMREFSIQMIVSSNGVYPLNGSLEARVKRFEIATHWIMCRYAGFAALVLFPVIAGEGYNRAPSIST
jgi:hypothetical protein